MLQGDSRQRTGRGALQNRAVSYGENAAMAGAVDLIRAGVVENGARSVGAQATIGDVLVL